MHWQLPTSITAKGGANQHPDGEGKGFFAKDEILSKWVELGVEFK